MGSPATLDALRAAVARVLGTTVDEAPVAVTPLTVPQVTVWVGPIDESTAPFEGQGATEAEAVGAAWAAFKAHLGRDLDDAERTLADARHAHRAAEARCDRARDALGAVRDAEDDGTSPFCHADRDGDCGWRFCPQLRDGEPARSGRSCPQRHHDDA